MNVASWGKMSVCLRREPCFSPQNLSRPPTLPNHMIIDVIESLQLTNIIAKEME
jgi:hypothetical protein